MLNYILIGIGIVLMLLSIMALIGGIEDQEEGGLYQLGYLIGTLIIAIPLFITGLVLLSVGLLRNSKEKRKEQLRFGCKCCRCSNCSQNHDHWTHD